MVWFHRNHIQCGKTNYSVHDLLLLVSEKIKEHKLGIVHQNLDTYSADELNPMNSSSHHGVACENNADATVLPTNRRNDFNANNDSSTIKSQNDISPSVK